MLSNETQDLILGDGPDSSSAQEIFRLELSGKEYFGYLNEWWYSSGDVVGYYYPTSFTTTLRKSMILNIINEKIVVLESGYMVLGDQKEPPEYINNEEWNRLNSWHNWHTDGSKR